MRQAIAAGILAGLLALPVAFGQSGAPASGNTERVESGEIHLPHGAAEDYRIRLLPVDAFPSLPVAVASWLEQRGCLIPQTFEAQGPENVIHGSFRSAGSHDWAALCSVHGTTTLYVFFAGEDDHPAALRSQPDTAWLGAEPGSSIYGSAWGISTELASDLRDTYQIQTSFRINHDAIEDSRLEQSLKVRYYREGKWLVLLTENFDSDD